MKFLAVRAIAWLAPLLALHAAPAQAEWLRAESDSFVVYSSGSLERLRERTAMLEEFDQLLRALTATRSEPAPRKLVVYLVPNGFQLQQINPVGSFAAGFYSATPDTILAVVNESANRGLFENQVLFHEYAHHFMLRYHPAGYPLWFVEGFAEYVMTARIAPDRIEYGNYNQVRASWLADRMDWLPYEDLVFGDPSRLGGARFYAQSWLLVHYLLSDAGRQARFADYLARIGRGEDRRQAFAAAMGIQPRGLQGILISYAQRIPYHRLERAAAPATTNMRVERLPASANDLLLHAAALELGVRERDREGTLNRVRRIAARHRDAYAQRVLARAELLYGDPAAADRLLDALLAASPSDAELLYLKGLRHLISGQRDAATRVDQYRTAQLLLARAHRADPDHYPTLFRYAESLSLGPRFLTENTQNILLLAVHLAPQVAQIRVSAAHLLLLREQYEQAEAVLLPLTSTVHEQKGTHRVRELLRLARARQRPPDGNVFAPLSDDDR